MENTCILHIVEREAWAKACAAGTYAPESLSAEGFIHCSLPGQLVATANRYYHGRKGLLVLVIDESRVSVPVRHEPVPGRGLFPHIYGELEPAAVIRALPLEPEADGSFRPPEGL
jgi:uncharacterized protein (DUF952 family)